MKKILGEDLPLIATWGFGQGFTDILNAAAITSKTYDSEILKQLRNISNEVQKAIDENGYSEAVIYVAVKAVE
ncbi:MAG: hypothetical protein JJE17_08520 [Peptostreptococcaceae bacterium]|nr:hypothetical protein [Peptostreptococcaceae bacterium]